MTSGWSGSARSQERVALRRLARRPEAATPESQPSQGGWCLPHGPGIFYLTMSQGPPIVADEVFECYSLENWLSVVFEVVPFT